MVDLADITIKVSICIGTATVIVRTNHLRFSGIVPMTFYILR